MIHFRLSFIKFRLRNWGLFKLRLQYLNVQVERKHCSRNQSFNVDENLIEVEAISMSDVCTYVLKFY